ncbi:MAG: DUF3465 domain-containing protein [Cyanobacteria bacterium P01_A01_bin.105]
MGFPIVKISLGHVTVLLLCCALSLSAPAPAQGQTFYMPTENITAAYQTGLSDVMVESTGVVERLLSDDNVGSRHQRLIVRVGPDQTVLVAHNIDPDIGSRVENIRVGDTVRFRGEYEWNELGGIVHWTHRDPDREHPDGWIEHNGVRYW